MTEWNGHLNETWSYPVSMCLTHFHVKFLKNGGNACLSQ